MSRLLGVDRRAMADEAQRLVDDLLEARGAVDIAYAHIWAHEAGYTLVDDPTFMRGIDWAKGCVAIATGIETELRALISRLGAP